MFTSLFYFYGGYKRSYKFLNYIEAKEFETSPQLYYLKVAKNQFYFNALREYTGCLKKTQHF